VFDPFAFELPPVDEIDGIIHHIKEEDTNESILLQGPHFRPVI